MALSTSTTARWTILSSSEAIPSGRCRPSAFGMYILREGLARYAPRRSRSCRSRRFSSRSTPYCSHVTPSTPAAACFFSCPNAVRSRSVVMWWKSAVNFASLSLLAACRTRASAFGALYPALRPGRVLLARVLLGQAPSLHPLRRRLRGIVRRLRRYYGPVRLPSAVHHRLPASGLPDAAHASIVRGQSRGLPVLAQKDSARAGVFDRAGSTEISRSERSRSCGLPRWLSASAPRISLVSRFHGPSPRVPLSNASPAPSRVPAHDSGPSWVATPST